MTSGTRGVPSVRLFLATRRSGMFTRDSTCSDGIQWEPEGLSVGTCESHREPMGIQGTAGGNPWNPTEARETCRSHLCDLALNILGNQGITWDLVVVVVVSLGLPREDPRSIVERDSPGAREIPIREPRRNFHEIPRLEVNSIGVLSVSLEKLRSSCDTRRVPVRSDGKRVFHGNSVGPPETHGSVKDLLWEPMEPNGNQGDFLKEPALSSQLIHRYTKELHEVPLEERLESRWIS